MVNEMLSTYIRQAAKLIFAGAFLFLSAQFSVHAQAKTPVTKQIHFADQQWEKTLQLAKKQHRLIFVDAYAVWCGPCRDLKTKTFRNSKVASYFNSHFVNVSLDMEKGEGLKFAEKYEVDSYPTLLLINGDGNVVSKSEGFFTADELNSWAKKAETKS